VHDAGLVGMVPQLAERLDGAGHGEQRLPRARHAHREVDDGVGVAPDDPRRVLGPLEVATRPVQVAGDARQQHHDTCCWWPPSARCRPGGGAAGGTVGGAAARLSSTLLAPTGVSTIQVSLLPPPCEELTMSEPFRRATRVRPPAVT